MGIEDRDRSGLGLWLLDFLEDILFEDFIVQLLLTASVQRESTDFAFHFSMLGLVPIILGAGATKFGDDISRDFIFKFPEVVAKRQFRLTGTMFVDNTVGVHVQNLLGL